MSPRCSSDETGPATILLALATLLRKIGVRRGNGRPVILGGSFIASELRALKTVGWSKMNGAPYPDTPPTEALLGVPDARDATGWHATLYRFTRVFEPQTGTFRLFSILGDRNVRVGAMQFPSKATSSVLGGRLPVLFA